MTCTLLLRGSLFKEAIATSRERLARTALAARLQARESPAGTAAAPSPGLETFVRDRLTALGVESGDDLALLSPQDFIAADVPYEIRQSLDHDYPLSVSVGDAVYRAEYDLDRNQVLLHMMRGSRKEPPPLSYLPKFPGLRICVASKRGLSVVREG